MSNTRRLHLLLSIFFKEVLHRKWIEDPRARVRWREWKETIAQEW